MGWNGESRRHSLARKKIKTAKGSVKYPRKTPTHIRYGEKLSDEENDQYQYWKNKLIDRMNDDEIMNSYELSYHIAELEKSGELSQDVADRLYDSLHFMANDKQKELDQQLKQKTSRYNWNYFLHRAKKSSERTAQIESIQEAGKHDPESLFYDPDSE